MGEISFASLLDAMRLLPLHIPTRYEEESSRRRNVPAHQQVSSRVQATESAMQQWVPALAIRFRAESGMRDGASSEMPSSSGLRRVAGQGHEPCAEHPSWLM
jgi:hypothetical protein